MSRALYLTLQIKPVFYFSGTFTEWLGETRNPRTSGVFDDVKIS